MDKTERATVRNRACAIGHEASGAGREVIEVHRGRRRRGLSGTRRRGVSSCAQHKSHRADVGRPVSTTLDVELNQLSQLLA